jgi:2-octaprenyl-6-methoxyphenol hydroxylase
LHNQVESGSKQSFDLIIAGGAMTGSTLALILDSVFSGSLSIAVVEPYQIAQQAHPGFDSRSIALSHGTVEILKRFQIWQEMKAIATPICHISVTDQGHAGMTNFDAQSEYLDALGYVVELADVGKIVTRQLAERPSITLFCPDKISQIIRNNDQVNVEVKQGLSLSAKLLVAADGSLSDCCEQVGLSLEEHDFNQVAVIANIGIEKPHQGRAFERFTRSGPLALLPMSQNRMSLVWCVSPERARQLIQLDQNTFLTELQDQFGWRLGRLAKVGERASYPLVMRSRSHTISHRFAAVGNAAQTLHPIAGQGFNLGIRDVVSLVESLRLCVDMEPPFDIGEYYLLSEYQQRRQHDRLTTMAMTSGLVHLFSNTWLPSMVGRNIGLMAMDIIPKLKTPLLQRTLGLVSR